MSKLPDITLPVWMNQGEPLTLAHASKVWWERVYSWLTFPLAQIDVDTCDEQLLTLLAYQRDITRFTGESLSLFRLRVKHAFVNAQDAGSKAGFERIFERLQIGQLQQLERQLQYDWDVILLRINDEQLSRDNTLMMNLVRQYGRTCRRYFFDVLNETPAVINQGHFGNEICYWSARAILRPTSVTATPEQLYLEPGRSGTIWIDVRPEDAEDRSFSAYSSDENKVAVVVSEGQLIVTALERGSATITVVTNDQALTAVVVVNVVSVTQFVTRINALDRPLFYVDMSESFTIDYGDGVDSYDYQLTENPGTGYGWVFSTRALTVGEEYSLVVKGADTLRFYASSRYTFNTLCEIIRVASDRVTLASFARGATGLTRIHEGAFDDLPYCTSAESAFHDCAALASVPDSLFEGLTRVTTFTYCFYRCTALKTAGDRLFKGCLRATSFAHVFYECKNLVSVGENIFEGCSAATTFLSAFRTCTMLTAMPLFTDCNKVTTFERCFAHCSSLQAITPYAFEGKALATNFQYVFYFCGSLAQIPAGVFKGCSSATSFAYAFQSCAGLATLSGDMFEGCTKVTNVRYLFETCRSLQTLPSMLFSSFTALTSDVLRMFAECTSLKSIPAGFFDNCTALTALTSSFVSCTALTELPAGLLKNNTKLTTVSGMFAQCYSLADVPADMFATNVLVTSFASVFFSTGLQVIPEDLFAGAVSAVDFTYAFYNCASLTNVPAGLFRNNRSATTFSYAFYACPALISVGDGLFDNTAATTLNYALGTCSALATNVQSIFRLASYPAITNVSGMLLSCTSMTGSALALITALTGVTTAAGKASAFSGATALDDYNDIPQEWGGPA